MKKMTLPYLQIEPSTICNYTCGFCAGRHMTQKHMKMETFKEVISAIQGLRYISIQGEGEPLLHPDFFEMVRTVRSEHPEASVSFITNGSLFSSDNIEEILSLGITRIMISIESADADLFREIRGGKLEKVISGIRRLVQTRNSKKLSQPVIGFAVTVMRKTMKDFKNVIALYRELEMDGGIAMQHLQKMESYFDIYDEEMKSQVLEREDIEWFESALKNDFPLGEIHDQAECSTNFYSSLIALDTPGCPWLEHSLYVNRDGIATGCCQIKDAENDGFGKFNLDAGEIVMAKRRMMQEQLLRGEEPSECKNCFIATKVINKVKEGRDMMV